MRSRFLDPIFSSGVYLAMNSAERAAEVVAASLREPRREAALQRDYARFVRRGLNQLSWFIFRFTLPGHGAIVRASARRPEGGTGDGVDAGRAMSSTARGCGGGCSCSS